MNDPARAPASGAPEVDARELLDCVEDAIVVVDDQLSFTYANRVAREFLGWSVAGDPAADVVDRVSSIDVIHPDDAGHVAERLADVVAGREQHGSLRLRIRSGAEGWRPVEATFTDRRQAPGIGGLVVCFRNLEQEERLRANLEAHLELDQQNRKLRAELHERQRFLSRLVRIQSSISRRAPLDDVLAAIIDGTTQLFGDITVGVLLRDPSDPSRLGLVASHGLSEEVKHQVTVNMDGVGRVAHREDRTVVVEGYGESPTAAAGLVAQGVRTVMSAPIRSGGLTVGSITIGSTWVETFTGTEREMLEILAEHAGIALLDASHHDHAEVALVDPLTNLANRRLLLDQLGRAIVNAKSSAAPTAVLFVDLDGFKSINDGRGHTAGDDVLKEVARRIEKTVGSRGSAARLGGDEFVVLLEACDVGEATATAESIARSIGAPLQFGRRDLYVGATVGVAMADHPAIDAEQLLRHADIAMYHGKRSGRGGVVVFEPSMEQAVIDRAELESELRRSIQDGSIGVAFQPVVDLRTGEVVSVETLARWSSPTQGPIAPNRFIELAERMHMVTELDLTVIDTACVPALELVDPATHAPLSISVNLSPQHLDREDAVQGLLSTATERGFPTARLIVEITETEAMRDPIGVGERIDELRAHGIRVAIDDFGTGYSSLAYLEQLAVDYVKIDRRFIEQITALGRSHSLVESMFRMIHSLGLTAVAEGVETVDQVRMLVDMGFELAQGYYFARPAAPADLRSTIGPIRDRLAAAAHVAPTLFD